MYVCVYVCVWGGGGVCVCVCFEFLTSFYLLSVLNVSFFLERTLYFGLHLRELYTLLAEEFPRW